MTTRCRAHAQLARTVSLVVAIAGGFIGSQTAAAQDSGAVNVNVADCIKLESPVERFACYEKRVGATLEQSDPSPVPGNSAAAPVTTAPVTAAPAAAAPVTAAPVTAAPSAAAPVTAAPSAAAPVVTAAPAAVAPATEAAKPTKPEEPEIVAVVAALRETVPNSYMITMDDGTLWRQTQPKFYPLRVGHKVRIYSTRWGSLSRLSAYDLNGSINVERVR